MDNEKYVAYVGTYTHENSVGIHLFDVDAEHGMLEERKVVPINNPSALVVSHNRKYLYSIADEGVEAFHILPDGDLKPINEIGIGGMRGCYLDLDQEDRYLFVAGYHDGRVSMMKLSEDGSIDSISDGVFHQAMGRSIAQRNFRPHVTCVKVTPEQKFLCAVDSGIDQVKLYRIDYENGKIQLADILRCPRESAPRMIRFSKDGKYAYVLCELSNCIEVYSYQVVKNQPVFEKIQTISTMGDKSYDICAASGMEISDDGKYLFCSNAGINTVPIFELALDSGILTQKCDAFISGDYPKSIAIFPNREYFMSLNHETNEITTFFVNYKNNTALMNGKPLKVDKPNCVYMHKL